MRYDWLVEDHLDAAVHDLATRGYHAYVVVDDWEETEFRRRFAPHSRLGRLDWPPLARVTGRPRSAHLRLGKRDQRMKLRPSFVLFIYCGLTVALTYPLILSIGSVLPNDAGDPALNTWILWWNTQAVPLSSAWWNAPAFYPAPGVLTFSENLLGLSLISTPLSWLGLKPQAAYNVVFLLTFPLSAIGAYLLTFELTQRRDAAFIAGLLFAFAPYRIAHLPQIQSLASFPMPFALLGLHRYLRDPRPKWLALFAGGWFLQGLCNGYYLLFFSVFAGMWILWFASPWLRPRQFVAIALAWLFAAVPMLPLLLHYRNVHTAFGFTRDFGTIRSFGADVAGLMFAVTSSRVVGIARRVSPRGRRAVSGADDHASRSRGRRIRSRSKTGASGKLGNRAQDCQCSRAHHRARIAERRCDGSMEIRAVWDSRALGDESHQAAHAFAGAGARPRLDEPGFRRTYAARSVLGFYAHGRFRDVAAQPWASANPDGERGHVSRSLYAPDVFARASTRCACPRDSG